MRESAGDKVKILIKLAVLALRIVYSLFKLCLRPRKKITLLSRQGNSESVDFMLLRVALEKQNFDGEIKVLCKKIGTSLFEKVGYIFHIFEQMYHIATSTVVVVDGYCIAVCVLKHKKETKVIQLWHALSAVKKFGHQSIGTRAGSDKRTAEIMCMHKNYDYVLAPSEITAKYYKEAFDIKDGQIKYLGMPRIDYILEKDGATQEKIYQRYPELKEKTNILYVPTFRKNESIKIEELVEKIDNSKYNLIIKLHPLDKQTSQPQKDGVIYDNEFGVYDLIKISDKIITDYSSLAMEVVLLDIPLYFYIYDVEEYKKSPGLNFDFEAEEIGIYSAVTVDNLLQKLEEEYDLDILNRFKDKYISVETNDCAGKIAEFLMNEDWTK